ncbi:flagellar hook-length control protein FliK [Chromobacterium alkanivorans]|uniref:flagellar hook-length control protein FliK n=1 Tax=Chromobacterium alkanivorans TaxID=1071719 RepID=UPI0019676275|nr:flagellar hook-length control protein FliK [Chromobacterium alkanivorans]MBN3005470.1 flagellar hook-length control protein FliK [Chromobacterium alkanivorans]
MNVSLPPNLLAGGASTPADAAPADPLLDPNAAAPESGGDFASALLASLMDGQSAAPAVETDAEAPAGDEAKAETPAAQPGVLAAQPLPLPLMPAMPTAVAPQAGPSAPSGVDATAAATPRKQAEAALPPEALSAALNTLAPLPAKPAGAGEAQAGRETQTPAQAAAPLLAAIAPQPQDKAAAPLPEWAPIKLPAQQPASWGDKLSAALGERLQVQSSHGMDRALIRLDPPSLGSLEISIRHEAGALQVQLTASHGEVVRQLQAIGDALRQDLSNRQYTQVAVEVREGAPGQGGHGQQRQERQGQQQPQRAPGRALAEAGQGDGQGFWLGQG